MRTRRPRPPRARGAGTVGAPTARRAARAEPRRRGGRGRDHHDALRHADLDLGVLAADVGQRHEQQRGLDRIPLGQEDERRDDLLETFVDDEPVEGEPVEVEGEFAGEWQTWTDEGGEDYAETEQL